MNAKTAILTFAAACALSAAPGDITANVPFPFEFNGKAMPAGNYQIRPSTDRHFLLAIHAKGPMFLFAAEPTSGVTIAQSILQFQPAAGRYVLSAIVDKSTGAFMKLPVSRAAKEMTAQATPVTVPITAAE